MRHLLAQLHILYPRTLDLAVVIIYKNGKISQRQSGVTVADMRKVPVRHLRSAFESKGSQIKQTEWDTYFNWHAKTSKRFQSFKTASLKHSLQKANEN